MASTYERAACDERGDPPGEEKKSRRLARSTTTKKTPAADGREPLSERVRHFPLLVELGREPPLVLPPRRDQVKRLRERGRFAAVVAGRQRDLRRFPGRRRLAHPVAAHPVAGRGLARRAPRRHLRTSGTRFRSICFRNRSIRRTSGGRSSTDPVSSTNGAPLLSVPYSIGRIRSPPEAVFTPRSSSSIRVNQISGAVEILERHPGFMVSFDAASDGCSGAGACSSGAEAPRVRADVRTSPRTVSARTRWKKKRPPWGAD